MTVTFNPSLAYRVTDDLSVAGGFGAVYGSLELDLGLPGGALPGPGTATLDGDDWAYGYSLSLMYELSEQTRLGAIYWSQVDLDSSGDLKAQPAGVGTDNAK